MELPKSFVEDVISVSSSSSSESEAETKSKISKMDTEEVRKQKEARCSYSGKRQVSHNNEAVFGETQDHVSGGGFVCEEKEEEGFESTHKGEKEVTYRENVALNDSGIILSAGIASRLKSYQREKKEISQEKSKIAPFGICKLHQ